MRTVCTHTRVGIHVRVCEHGRTVLSSRRETYPHALPPFFVVEYVELVSEVVVVHVPAPFVVVGVASASNVPIRCQQPSVSMRCWAVQPLAHARCMASWSGFGMRAWHNSLMFLATVSAVILHLAATMVTF